MCYIFRLAPCATVVVANRFIGAIWICRRRLPQALTAYEDCDETFLVIGVCHGAVAESFHITKALRESVRLAPCHAAVGAVVT